MRNGPPDSLYVRASGGAHGVKTAIDRLWSYRVRVGEPICPGPSGIVRCMTPIRQANGGALNSF